MSAMFTYLLQVTAIWAISAMLYEALLIREASHRLNRIYLLGTLLLGVVSPLISLGNNPIPTEAIVHPITNLSVMTPAFADHASLPTAAVAPGAESAQIPWLLLIYSIGCLIMLARLVAAFAKLIRMHQRGSKKIVLGYRFIETGGAHGPFSFFRHIYISRIADFDFDDLKLIAAHEMRHARYLHVLDILITEVLKIALWMHPLVYWYGSRLRRLHEYEADSAAKEAPGRYGILLLNQMLLSEGPCIAHSFYHAPIRLRIRMIMTKPGRTPFLKYLLVVPLLCAVMIGCMKERPAASAAAKKGNKISHKGNELEMGELSQTQVLERLHDTIHHRGIRSGPYPVKLNGQKIHEDYEVSAPPAYVGKYPDASTDLFVRLQDLLEQLPDGTYQIPLMNVIVDDKGKLAYYQGEGLFPLPADFRQRVKDTSNVPSFCINSHPIIGNNCPDFPKVDSNLVNAIQRKTIKILDNDIAFSPAKIKGHAVPAYLNSDLNFTWYKLIEVKSHHAILVTHHERS